MRRLTTFLAFLCLCIIHSHSFRRHETVRNAFAVHLTNNPNNIGASTKKYVNNIFRRVAAVIVTPFLAFKRANAVTSTGITVVPLDYSYNALEPYISERTLKFHHDKHYSKYVANTQSMIKDTDLENADLVQIVKKSFSKKNLNLFNNAAQSYNHEFYFKCMSPKPTKISKTMENAIEKSFGSYEEFKKQFSTAATGLFGSGWVWLVKSDKNDRLEIMKTANADTPLTMNRKCLLTIDVWEHAYYLDYQNLRNKYVDNFMDNLIDWDFVETNYRQ